jgi:hypothetical protein
LEAKKDGGGAVKTKATTVPSLLIEIFFPFIAFRKRTRATNEQLTNFTPCSNRLVVVVVKK